MPTLIQLDISSIDLNFWGGPFVPAGGLAPSFGPSLYDNATGTVDLSTPALLDSVDIRGSLPASLALLGRGLAGRGCSRRRQP
ncbi:hypothetical protein [Accumulibacter sp.]|uniref:hypothetical protein n=1 Tax=Accumulibacter sp. TaxID=2053492 RepID=UPI001ACF38C0|nr:hypothetical protein [Accumulibacter sp.]MBN8453469.1 hypothetical protein [Accumulibacter sp.]MBO3705797.1 hypothetical protein [Candidatus Accumulibacter conexus]